MNRALRALRAAPISLVLLCCGFISGCGGGDDDHQPVQATGRVLDSRTGQPLAGVAVSTGKTATVTDAEGGFQLADLPAGEPAILHLTLAGYGSAHVSIDTRADSWSDARLTRVDGEFQVDAAQRQFLYSGPSHASVVIPPYGLAQRDTGTPASGAVVVTLVTLAPQLDLRELPGRYEALAADGTRSAVETFGLAEMTAKDAAGHALEISKGVNTELTIKLVSRGPLIYGRVDEIPEQLTLYHFDESIAAWVAKGEVSHRFGDDNLAVEIDQLGHWMIGHPSPSLRVSGCVVDEAGKEVRGAAVEASALDILRRDAAVSQSHGRFEVDLPKGSRVALVAQLGDRVSNVVELPPGESDVALTECLKLGKPDAAPTIAVEPFDQVTGWSNVGFAVQATAGTRPLTYQWYRDGVAIAGATGPRYTISRDLVDDYDGVQFSVEVRAAGQADATASRSALLTHYQNLLFLEAPVDAAVSVGQPATFSVAVRATGRVTYQWLRNDQPIAGATGRVLQTPPATLADDGTVYSVVVSTPYETDHREAKLVVTEPTAAGGLHLVLSPGEVAHGDLIVFADGARSIVSPALYAVSTAAPSQGFVAVPAGQAVYGPRLRDAVLNGSQVSQTRVRYVTYFRHGRLQALDLLTTSGPPVQTTRSTLTSEQVCYPGTQASDQAVDGSDLAQGPKGWAFFRAPGADNTCNSADDNFLAVRMDMRDTDAPVHVGRPLVVLRTASGQFAGLIAQSGAQVIQWDRDLATRTPLFEDANPIVSAAHVFGTVAPGIWLFESGDRIYAYRLGTTGSPTLVTQLAADETRPWLMSDGVDEAFVAINRNAGSARILRIDENLSTTQRAVLDAKVHQLESSPTRIVAMVGSRTPQQIVSMDRHDGDWLTISSDIPDWGYLRGPMVVSGENVYFEHETDDRDESVMKMFVVGSDGSNSVTLNRQVLLGSSAAPNAARPFGTAPAYAVFVQDEDYDRVLSLEGATRAELVNYGDVLLGHDWSYGRGWSSLAQYGEPTLFFTQAYDNGTGESYELTYFVDTDRAALERVTMPLIPCWWWCQDTTAATSLKPGSQRAVSTASPRRMQPDAARGTRPAAGAARGPR